MAIGYKPYFDPNYESMIERIHPPRVCVDNETCTDCTLVKVDRANKHEILVEMVQVLTDLDLLISKSYISSDGGWCMDVFHVTDQLGHKLTDDTLIHYIEQSLCGGRRGDTKEVIQVTSNRTSIGSIMRSLHVSTNYTAFEFTAIDKPGLLSEISAVLAELGCNVAAAVVWTHKKRAASVLYIEDESKGGGPITSAERMLHVEEQLAIVVGAHHGKGERRVMRLVEGPPSARVHTGRRLHQLMQADMHHEISRSKDGNDSGKRRRSGSNNIVTEVCIENCKEKGYTVVNVRCKDRPKLLFDTVCTLTDLGYVVFHAAISSRDSLAVQEYYIRQRDGCTLDSERERQRVMQYLIEASERRISHGVKLDVCTKNRVGLLSDITRVFREHGLSVSRAEISTLGEKAIGSFYVTDAYTGKNADPKTVELVRSEIGATVLEANKSISAEWSSNGSNSQNSRSSSTCSGDVEERPAKSSVGLGSLLWAQFERLSSNSGGSA